MTVSTSTTPKVSVCVITYNHARYLSSCLQSIVDQEVDFSFEIIVGEDCSTDGTQAILQEFRERYPDLIRPIYQTVNTGGGQNFADVHAAARGTYIAHIDGDDYALPGKLQKQVDYLDANPWCNVVWHLMARQSDCGAVRFPNKSRPNSVMSFTKGDCLAIGSIGVHSSKMYRSFLRTSYSDSVRHQYDFELDLLQIGSGFGSLLPDVLGVYRVGVGGLTSISDSRSRRLLDEILSDYYQRESIYRGQISSLFLMLAIVDIKNRRGHMKRSVKKFLSHFSPFAVVYLFLYARKRYFLRSIMKN